MQTVCDTTQNSISDKTEILKLQENLKNQTGTKQFFLLIIKLIPQIMKNLKTNILKSQQKKQEVKIRENKQTKIKLRQKSKTKNIYKT